MQGKTSIWFTVFCLSWFAGRVAHSAEMYDLRPSLKTGALSAVDVVLEVAGELKVPTGESANALPMQVKATAKYEEGVVAGASTPVGGRRFARRYDEIEARFQVDGRRMAPSLPNEHRYLIADWSGKTLERYLPIGNLTQDELDLVSIPADSAVVDMLLPDHPVARGDRWQYMPEILAGVLGLDQVDSSDVETELREVDVSSAKCELAGKVSGSIGGVSSEMELKAKFTFDVTSKRVTWLAMLVKEKRAIGHAMPGVEATSRLQMKISPLAAPRLLPANMASMNVDPTPANLALRYKSPSAGFEFDYDRRWQMLSNDEKGASFRFVDRGELVAQLNVVPLKKSATGRPVELSTFQTDIQKALGDNFGQFVTAAQNADVPGRLVYRVVCTGNANELPVQWNYHLVSNDAGEQVLLIVTLEAQLVERFGDQDQFIIDRVRLPGARQTATRNVIRR